MDRKWKWTINHQGLSPVACFSEGGSPFLKLSEYSLTAPLAGDLVFKPMTPCSAGLFVSKPQPRADEPGKGGPGHGGGTGNRSWCNVLILF